MIAFHAPVLVGLGYTENILSVILSLITAKNWTIRWIMAEGDQPGHNEPSLSMKVVLSTVRHTFRNVRQLSTDALAELMVEARGENSGEGSTPKWRKMVLLV